jgi:hypothetical protein
MDQFVEMVPDRSLCELVQLAPMTQYVEYANYTCGAESCVRRCAYDARCKYAMWRPGSCIKTVAAQLTDDPRIYRSYVGRAFAKMSRYGGDVAPVYWAGRCNLLTYEACAIDPDCGVNQGKRGVNDELYGGSANWYCGRIKCLNKQ